MPAVSGEIPLLPVPSVLFPGTFLPMQVTEEAQRAMLRDCVQHSRRVGIVYSPGQGNITASSVPYTIGCLASVAMLAQGEDEYDEEPISVVLHGEQRIRVLKFVQQDPYLTGHFEMLSEYGGLHAERRSEQASRIFKQYLQLIQNYYGTDITNITLPSDPVKVSYALASVLYLPTAVKQRWLESPSTTIRLEEELGYLQAECEKHETLLALSAHTDQRYSLPDPQLYLSLTTPN